MRTMVHENGSREWFMGGRGSTDDDEDDSDQRDGGVRGRTHDEYYPSPLVLTDTNNADRSCPKPVGSLRQSQGCTRGSTDYDGGGVVLTTMRTMPTSEMVGSFLVWGRYLRIKLKIT